MQQIRIELDHDKAQKLKSIVGSVYEGYPYLVTKIVPTLIHVIPLPGKGIEWLRSAAVEQARANDLPTCLVLGESVCLYLDAALEPCKSDILPFGSVVYGKLRFSRTFDKDPDLVQRERALVIYEKGQNKGGFLHGDLRKGGKRATPVQIKELTGLNALGLPKGLSACPVCQKAKGWCLDPSDKAGDWLVPAHCDCDNMNLCAHCGRKLDDTKLNGNYYQPRDGRIWHTPGFCGLGHQCSDDSD